VSIYARNHPVSHISTYFSNALFQGRIKNDSDFGHVEVGNNVWIGHGSIILNNVIIGEGSVIGAGSIVTKNIPNFCVAAGNPAKVIRNRFRDEITELLLELRWWDSSEKNLLEMEELFHLDITENEADAIKLIKKYISSMNVNIK
jgi:tetrahydrodipicolinate N-succinyltransferase